MIQGWEIARLGEVCEFINRGISPKYIETDGVCVLNQKCIRNHYVCYDESRRHDSSFKPVNPERFVKVGDVLVNSTGTGTLGRVAQIHETPKELTTVDSHVTIVRPKNDLFFSDFFGYMLIHIEDMIKGAGEGCGGQTELARSVLSDKFYVHFPKSLPEQHRIVSILDQVFAAIDKAKANAEKNLKNAKELFESYLQGVFEKKGDDWETQHLLDIVDERCTLSYGIVQPGEEFPNGLPVIRPTDLTTKYIHLVGLKLIDPRLADSYKRTTLMGNELLLCVRGNTGVISIATIELNGANVTRGIVPICFNPKIIKLEFGYYQFISNFIMKQIKGKTYGTALMQINIGDLRKVNFLIPPLSKQQSIVQKLDALSAETKRLEAIYQQKLLNLEELKKSMLQKAFNGEI